MDYENINTEEFASCSEVATTQINWPTLQTFRGAGERSETMLKI